MQLACILFEIARCLANMSVLCGSALAASAPPPYGLPPWSPGMAPPVPGPVFSPAFKALLVLMVGGGAYFAYTLYINVKKIREGEGGIGGDNAMLTAANPGGADWMRSIQVSRGRTAGKAHAVDLGGSLPKPRAKGKGAPKTGGGTKEREGKQRGKSKSGGSGGKSRRRAECDEEEEDAPLARPKGSKSKTLRAGGAKGSVTEMAPIKPSQRR